MNGLSDQTQQKNTNTLNKMQGHLDKVLKKLNKKLPKD
eukprot:CAMPEP_0116873730 /NCGR_PEP_ID=MMETSP0463-20121206/5017_1 /TAXON_ID=181622 /ORGANISM="Strombidinopsis sp, Strain SopsisLIS2011" /LENGTH=37 /DNA_ID= /DNA_START= /DNA_END= /DNA_ORIENTATION=